MKKNIHCLIFALALLPFAMAQNASPSPNPSPAPTPQPSPQLPLVPKLAVVVPAGNPPEQCVDKLLDGVKAYRSSHDVDKLRQTLEVLKNTVCGVYLLLNSKQYIAASANARQQLLSINQVQLQRIAQITKEVKAIAQQDGASSGAGGSTSLTSKGVAAKFLSLASEYGALSQSTSNLTTTVQGTLAGIPVVLMKKGLAEECSVKLLALTPCFRHNVLDWLNAISYSISFDSSQSGQSLTGTASGQSIAAAQPATFTASTHSINAVTAKFIALRGGKVDGTALDNEYQNFISDPQSKEMSDAADFLETLRAVRREAFVAWQNTAGLPALEKAIDAPAATDRSIVEAWKSTGTGMAAALGVPEEISPADAGNNDVIQNAATFAAQYIVYLGREEAAALRLAKPPVLTIEYDENRPANQPTNSVFRVIYQRAFPQVTLTANGAFSIYDSDPSASIPGASRLRDIQAAFEADHDIQINTALTGKMGMTASGAYYFQHQSSPAILNVNPSSPVPGVTFVGLPTGATQVFAQKGNISIGQLKLTIGSGSSIKVPFSVTYSNRTELVTKPVWRGQVGISYDFDSLFQNASSK
jgi:hypothetical protein